MRSLRAAAKRCLCWNVNHDSAAAGRSEGRPPAPPAWPPSFRDSDAVQAFDKWRGRKAWPRGSNRGQREGTPAKKGAGPGGLGDRGTGQPPEGGKRLLGSEGGCVLSSSADPTPARDEPLSPVLVRV